MNDIIDSGGVLEDVLGRQTDRHFLLLTVTVHTQKGKVKNNL